MKIRDLRCALRLPPFIHRAHIPSSEQSIQLRSHRGPDCWPLRIRMRRCLDKHHRSSQQVCVITETCSIAWQHAQRRPALGFSTPPGRLLDASPSSMACSGDYARRGITPGCSMIGLLLLTHYSCLLLHSTVCRKHTSSWTCLDSCSTRTPH